MTDSSIILVTGAARSGKSEWAEILAARSHKSVIYVATASCDPADAEWQQRIAQHRQRRPKSWQTLQESIALSATLTTTPANTCLLIDSLGTWLANILEQDNETWANTLAQFLASLQRTQSDVILVAEEVGWGVVPVYPAGRLFRDRLGELVRQVGAIAHPVYLVTGGHVLNLSRLGTPLDTSSEERT
ncbi:MAG: bifunctional adenosylcobinamide kinase/adenosylcobinamide-phosphate guanylyltransferase [Scytolyngbya sp. HA4215-MV1]|jgi:adenosylcobinamide kinase/adenosylcobinamide-phosphate guanylyltransferase|nr:bifunctional adenosylcobinamide kinase/adenosylcobinamide-phosphate guanylyltransferase [Scytolyngbya sp. HA4215-MV1]